jgi:hypothetical protein
MTKKRWLAQVIVSDVINAVLILVNPTTGQHGRELVASEKMNLVDIDYRVVTICRERTGNLSPFETLHL